MLPRVIDRSQVIGIWLAGLFLCGCCTQVSVPDRSADAAPTITLDAFPLVPAQGAVGDVEQQNVSVSTTVRVTRGRSYALSATAYNPKGGVATISMTAVQGGNVKYEVNGSNKETSSGSTCTTLSLLTAPANQVMSITMTSTVTVVVSATNFNGMTSTITVQYVPADLTVTMTATPNAIGYQHPASATLAWSALFGQPPYKFSMSPKVVSDPVNVESTAVSPTKSTVYSISVKDQVSTQSAQALVDVIPVPPPPKIHLSASPDNGYAMLGVPQTVSWTVDNCGVSPCTISLTGTGTGYATGINVSLSNLNPMGSFTMTPKDITEFVMNASSIFGSDKSSINMSIAPSQAQSPNLAVFYFTIVNPNGVVATCTALEVVSDTLADAEKAALNTYGSGWTVGRVLTASEFNAGLGCSSP
jgi:hypothetical protein